MAQEQVLDSFLLRVVIRNQRETYTLQNLRTGELITLTDSHKILDYVSHGSTKHPPWRNPETS